MVVSPGHRGVNQRDAAAHHIDHGLATALVRHMGELRARANFEQLTRDVRCAAGARGAVGQTARCFFRQGDQLLQVFGRHVGVGHQDQSGVANFANRRVIVDGVETHFGKHVGVDDHGAVKAHHPGVAIWRCGLDQGHADIARSTGFVVDHDLLVQSPPQVLGHQTRTGVGHAAGGEGHDDANGFVGEGIVGGKGA